MGSEMCIRDRFLRGFLSNQQRGRARPSPPPSQALHQAQAPCFASFSDPSSTLTMSISPDGVYEKGVIDPGLPVQNSTRPFWLTEPSRIAQIRSLWPDEVVDVAIIGSGMTAASLSRTLYAKRPGIKIVLVEARDLCSGATGRNGGHIKAMSPGAWNDRKKSFGLEEGLRITEFEHSHVEEQIACCLLYTSGRCRRRLRCRSRWSPYH